MKIIQAAFGASLAFLAAVLFGCGGDPVPSPPTPPPAPTPRPTPAPPPTPPTPKPPPTTTTTTTATTTTTTTTSTTTFDCHLDETQPTHCIANPKGDDITLARIGKAIQFCCGSINCTTCTREDPHVKGTYIFNEYFHKNIDQGNDACHFDGAGKLDWPDGSPCTLATKKDSEKLWCLPKASIKDDELDELIKTVCGMGTDCKEIAKGGGCVYPPAFEKMHKAEYAFNKYFQTSQKTKRDCDFDGRGELMSPTCEMVPEMEQLNWCQEKPNASQSVKDKAMEFICGNGVLCNRCKNEANKLSWAMNEYFQAHLDSASKNVACDFNGAAHLSWPPGSPCIPKPKEGKLCRPKASASAKSLQAHLEFICSQKGDFCKLIDDKTDGGCVFPQDEALRMKSTLAFNNYYQKWKQVSKDDACNFDGDGELVDPSESSVIVA